MNMIDGIRHELESVLNDDLSIIDEDRNLIEAGLHSLAIMRLIEPLSRLAGRRLDYADLAYKPTLRAWNTLLCRHQTG